MSYDERKVCELPKQYLAALTGYTYARIGLFATTPQYGLENFADVHFRLSTGIVRGAKVWFSGPTDSIRQIANLKRSRREREEYTDMKHVSPDLDITNGGEGFGWGPHSNALDVWLFGPLIVFDTFQVGTLLLKLTGNFKPGRGRQQMQVRWSTYSDGLDDFPIPSSGPRPSDLEWQSAYDNQVRLTQTLPLPAKTQLSWKLEALAHDLNACEVVQKHDTSKKLRR
jgi:hypothetical protein